MAFDDFYFNAMGDQGLEPSATQFEKEQYAQALKDYNATRGYLFTSPHTTGNNLFSEQGYTNPVMNVQSTPINESTPATNVTPPSASPTPRKRLSATDLTMKGIKDGTIGIASNNDDGSITYKDGTTRYNNGYAITGKGVIVDPQGKYWTQKNKFYESKRNKALGLDNTNSSELIAPDYSTISPNDRTYADLNNPNYEFNYNPNYIPADNIIAAASQIKRLGLDPYDYFGYNYSTDNIDPNKITFTPQTTSNNNEISTSSQVIPNNAQYKFLGIPIPTSWGEWLMAQGKPKN